MTDTIRWGVLGAANFARQHMAPAIHGARGAELSALATSSEEKAAPFRAFAPGLRVHGTYEALLADPEIDAIYVPLPNHLHCEWALKALEAGKHVLVEKPMGLKATDLDPVIAARDRTGLLAAEAFMIVHHPQFQRARELVQGGAIGALVQVDCVFSFMNRDGGNIRNRPETGGGAMGDIGVYALGSARFVTGAEPEAVDHAHVVRENGVDVTARIAARFPGFLYSGTVSMRAFPRQYVAFHGEEGVLTLTCPFNAGVFDQAALRLEREAGRVEIERWPGVNQYVLQVEAFGRSVRDGVPYDCPLEFSRGTQAMTDMVFAAADG